MLKLLDYLDAPPEVFTTLKDRVSSLSQTPFFEMKVESASRTFYLEETYGLEHHVSDDGVITRILILPRMDRDRSDLMIPSQFSIFEKDCFTALGTIVEYLCKTMDDTLKLKLLSWVQHNPWLFSSLGHPEGPLRLHMDRLAPQGLHLYGDSTLWCCTLISELSIAANDAVYQYIDDNHEQEWWTDGYRGTPANLVWRSTQTNCFPIISRWDRRGAAGYGRQVAYKRTGRIN